MSELDGQASHQSSQVVSCGDCVMQYTDHCNDCLVSFICGREPDDAVIIDVAEAQAVRLLTGAGMLPTIKHVPRAV